MFKYIAGIWLAVVIMISLSGLVLPLLISTNRIPVYVLIVIVPGVIGLYFWMFCYLFKLTYKEKKSGRKRK